MDSTGYEGGKIQSLEVPLSLATEEEEKLNAF